VFRTIQGVILPLLVALIDAAAITLAVHNDRVTSLLIGAAMVGTSALILGVMMDRRLGDAYDSGSRRARQLLAAQGRRRA
jgi:hypothetical protein